jgi:UDP-N-acetylglucosamine 3-dehydrogenase
MQPVEVAIVGPGRMGRIYARLVAESGVFHLAAVCGRDETSTQSLAREYNTPGYPGADVQAMLAAHPNIEAVIVASSEWAHSEPALAALAAGKHVLVEKPLATSASDGAEILRQAGLAGVTLMVCHSLRFDPRFAAMRQAVAGGAIGEILHLYARRNPGQAAVDRVLGRFPLAYWLLPHDIDMMLWTTGSHVTRVMAYSRNGGKERTDFIIAVLTFASGAIGVVESSWGTPAQGGRPQNELFTVRGAKGAAEVLGYENGVAIYHDGAAEHPDTGYTPVIHEQLDGIFRRLLWHFAGVVRGRWTPIVTGYDGLAAVVVASAIDRSLVEQRPIEIADGWAGAL